MIKFILGYPWNQLPPSHLGECAAGTLDSQLLAYWLPAL